MALIRTPGLVRGAELYAYAPREYMGSRVLSCVCLTECGHRNCIPTMVINI